MNVGQVKGFMVNGRTGRLRVYGELSDAGLFLGAITNKRTIDAIEELRSALQAQCNSSQAKALLKQQDVTHGNAAYLQLLDSESAKPTPYGT